MTSEDARRLFTSARVARLSTADTAARPHIVPFVFAVSGDTIYSAVDHKPKRTTALRRLANIAENPLVSALVDEYDDRDWARLCWARADGFARIVDAQLLEYRQGMRLLCERYNQYSRHSPNGPLLAIDVERWSGWKASDADASGSK